VLTKLTLSVDNEVVERAKTYARRRGRSVSRLVEDYLRNVSSREPLDDSHGGPETPITDGVTGMFAAEYHGQEYGDLLDDALRERYL